MIASFLNLLIGFSVIQKLTFVNFVHNYWENYSGYDADFQGTHKEILRIYLKIKK